MEENKRLKYESPHVSVRRMISESGLLVGSGYTPGKEMKGSVSISITNMKLQEGTDNIDGNSNIDGSYAFHHDWYDEE